MRQPTLAVRRGIAPLAIAASALALAAPVSASGPAPPGKEPLTLDCGGLGTVTVAPPNGEKTMGAAQIVGTKGHVIPTRFVFNVTDLRTGAVVVSETQEKGHGHANRNQETTTCSGVLFEGTFAETAPPGTPIPPGVEPTDILQGSVTITVVVK